MNRDVRDYRAIKPKSNKRRSSRRHRPSLRVGKDIKRNENEQKRKADRDKAPENVDAISASKQEPNSSGVGVDTDLPAEITLRAFALGGRRCCFLFDTMSSAYGRSGDQIVAVPDHEWDKLESEYHRLFRLGVATFQMCVYFHSRMGSFWQSQPPADYNKRSMQLSQLARQSGWLALDADLVFGCFHANGLADGGSAVKGCGDDWRRAMRYQRILTLMMAVGRFVSVDEPLAKALGSCPLKTLRNSKLGMYARTETVCHYNTANPFWRPF